MLILHVFEPKKEAVKLCLCLSADKHNQNYVLTNANPRHSQKCDKINEKKNLKRLTAILKQNENVS